MHDLVVRNGTVVDGTGAARRQVDVAIDDGLITALEPKAGRARREVNAEGLLVTPGWVDIHTHYDGQATWDPAMTPSSWHRCDDHDLRQLRGGLCAGSAWQRELPHQLNGRRRGHSRDR